MLDITHPEIIHYLREIIPEKRNLLSRLEQEAAIDFVPILQPESVRFIEWLIHLKKPKRILEIGTAIGYSAIAMAWASNSVEHITTVELSETMFERAKLNFQEAELTDRVSLILGDGYEVMLKLIEDQVEPYDLIFIDAAKGQYQFFFDGALKLLSTDGMILCDNVLLHGLVTSPKTIKKRKRTMVRKLDLFNRETLKLEGYKTSLIPVGDGLLLISPE